MNVQGIRRVFILLISSYIFHFFDNWQIYFWSESSCTGVDNWRLRIHQSIDRVPETVKDEKACECANIMDEEESYKISIFFSMSTPNGQIHTFFIFESYFIFWCVYSQAYLRNLARIRSIPQFSYQCQSGCSLWQWFDMCICHTHRCGLSFFFRDYYSLVTINFIERKFHLFVF